MMNRRKFLLSAFSLTLSIPFLFKNSKKAKAEEKLKMDISEMKEGEVKSGNLEGKTIYIKKKSADDYIVLIGHCPHQGCVVSVNNTGGWECPCHHAKFDERGKVLQGPAKEDLTLLPYKIKGNEIEIIK